MRLFLVRHGRTASNVHGLVDTAFPGADLDAVGRSQADALVERLAGSELGALYASNLVRTQQTVAPLSRQRGLAPTILPGLREIAAGDQEMSTNAEAYIAVLSAWAGGDLGAARPGGESGRQFFARYDAAIEQIAFQGHESAAVVSHGAAMRMWVGGRVRGLTHAEFASVRLGNAAIIQLEGDTVSGWRFVSWDEADEIG